MVEKDYLEIIARLDQIEKRLKIVESEPIIENINPDFPKNSDKPATFGDFARIVNPKTYEERAITIAYYINKYNGQLLSRSKINDYNKKVAWPTYTNMPMLFTVLKKKGFIEENGKTEQGEVEYRILTNGIELIEKKYNEGLNGKG